MLKRNTSINPDNNPLKLRIDQPKRAVLPESHIEAFL